MKERLQIKEAKKGQAAMEFLMTYGWALLVVLVAIGALAFFGVLNPGQFLPDQCLFFSGFSCLNPYASAGSAVMVFGAQNGLGYTMNTQTISMKVSGTAVSGTTVTLGGVNYENCEAIGSIADGAVRYCAYTISASQGDRLKGEATITWFDSGANSRQRTASISVTVEA